MQEQEDLGIKFLHDGVPTDVITILKEYGFNYIRLRLFVEPGAADGYQHQYVERQQPYCDLQHTIMVAQKVKRAGLGFLLDLHYSDTWADPGDQFKPASWEGLSFADLTRKVSAYTRDTLLAFIAAGAAPDMVQVGNEITSGFIFPDGELWPTDNRPQFLVLLRAGLAAVKSVDTNIKTVVHITRADDINNILYFLDGLIDPATGARVAFDILGLSTYTALGSIEGFENTFKQIELQYPDLPVISAEYSGEPRRINDAVFNTPRGLGTFIWEPTKDGSWGNGLFGINWNTHLATPRSTLDDYPGMVQKYGLR